MNAREKAVGCFELGEALKAVAMANIAQRALERRREAIHDALLVAGAAVSLALASAAGAFLWLLVNGSV